MASALWEFICNSPSIIQQDNKPFGHVLPTEIQSRIVCMAWEQHHREQWKKVMGELQCLSVCTLTEWCSHPHQARGFNRWQHLGWCSGDCHLKTEEMCWKNHTRTCTWCTLYKHNRSSLEVQRLDKVWREAESGFSCYDDAGWSQYCQRNCQQYYDVYQHTMTVVLVPMLVVLPAGRLQMNRKFLKHRIHCATIRERAEEGLETFMSRVGVYEFENPQTLTRLHQQRRAAEQERLAQLQAPKQHLVAFISH